MNIYKLKQLVDLGDLYFAQRVDDKYGNAILAIGSMATRNLIEVHHVAVGDYYTMVAPHEKSRTYDKVEGKIGVIWRDLMSMIDMGNMEAVFEENGKGGNWWKRVYSVDKYGILIVDRCEKIEHGEITEKGYMIDSDEWFYSRMDALKHGLTKVGDLQEQNQRFFRDAKNKVFELAERGQELLIMQVRLSEEVAKESTNKSTHRTFWIPMSEQLPELEQRVQFCSNEGDIIIGWLKEDEPGDYYIQGDHVVDSIKSFTYWYPLRDKPFQLYSKK